MADGRLRQLASRYRLHLPGRQDACETLVFGEATARPADMLRMIDAVGRGAAGSAARAPLPTIVQSYRLRGEPWRQWSAGSDVLDITDQFASPRAAEFTRGVLAAPVEQGGTLAGLGATLGHVAVHIGKSGTSQAGARGRDRGKFAVGAFARGRQRYAYFLMVDARDPIRGLADRLGWSPLLPGLRTVAAPVDRSWLEATAGRE